MKMCYGRVDRNRLKRRQEASRVGRFVRAVLRPRRRLYAQHPPARHVDLPPSLPAAVQPKPTDLIYRLFLNRQAENSINNARYSRKPVVFMKLRFEYYFRCFPMNYNRVVPTYNPSLCYLLVFLHSGSYNRIHINFFSLKI